MQRPCFLFGAKGASASAEYRGITQRFPYQCNKTKTSRLLGNVVISKNFLRTRKIMVMHSNERGECCPCTLVDRKRKRYDNAVDVVVCLHDPTDPSTERTAPPCSAHVQLDDVPRAPIQQSVGDEFRQHDGVVMMIMFYRRRASPKLRDDMTEVEYGGGGHRTRLRNDP